MTDLTIIGIDPGAKGGIAVQKSGQPAKVFKMGETDVDILRILESMLERDNQNCIVFLEQIVKHMGDGTPASSMATYSSNWGMMKGIVLAHHVRLELVPPQRWQKALGLGNTGRVRAVVTGMTQDQAKAEKKRIKTINAGLKRDWKNKLKGEAQRRHPYLDITLETADAVLILEYGKMTTLSGRI